MPMTAASHSRRAPRQPERRQTQDMVAKEAAYQAGLRRRATDREEVVAYYLMFSLTLGILLFIGVGSWVAR